ncbi:hypothetical protein QFZ22_009793 [Streptomyces canus]|uniref:Uncharacterized protein n=1 Tax=Streptomyces canus TaxID=58343 RepID=A0AAW8FXS2_9ACTN|nr:hypothetical protein [Streptomyces canus]
MSFTPWPGGRQAHASGASASEAPDPCRSPGPNPLCSPPDRPVRQPTGVLACRCSCPPRRPASRVTPVSLGPSYGQAALASPPLRASRHTGCDRGRTHGRVIPRSTVRIRRFVPKSPQRRVLPPSATTIRPRQWAGQACGATHPWNGTGSATHRYRNLSGERLARVVVSLDARVELLLEGGRVVERLLGRRGLPQLLQLRGLGLEVGDLLAQLARVAGDGGLDRYLAPGRPTWRRERAPR